MQGKKEREIGEVKKREEKSKEKNKSNKPYFEGTSQLIGQQGLEDPRAWREGNTDM